MSERAEAFHANPWQGVLYVTGGGSPFISELLSTPGASKSVLEVSVPYASQALTELIKGEPEQAASNQTARQLAMAAYQRARVLNPDNPTLFGLGCTASLATDREKKGTHRAHWAIQTKEITWGFSATYTSDREAEEAMLCDQLFACITHLANGQSLPHDIDVQMARPKDGIAELLDVEPQRFSTVEHDGLLLLPGSFNPLHDGHRQIMACAEAHTGRRGAYEITVRNADKPAIDFISLEERLAGIADHPVWLTNTPTYAAKAELFPGATFAIGVDTIQRVGEVRFYEHRTELMHAAFDRFSELGCKFLVFGRLQADEFLTLSDITLPVGLGALCEEVPEAEFRLDISSTELRR